MYTYIRFSDPITYVFVLNPELLTSKKQQVRICLQYVFLCVCVLIITISEKFASYYFYRK